MNKSLESSVEAITHFLRVFVTIVAIPFVDLNIPGIYFRYTFSVKSQHNFQFFFSLKHPAKYIGKKPRKYTIPAKPLAPNIINDQVRIYSTNSTSGDGQVMHNTHSSQYLRVRLNLQKFRENNRHFLRVMPLLEYYSNTCSELLCVVCQFLISVLEPFFSIST